MPRVGEQGDVLRALGRFFDEQGAQWIQIHAHENIFAATWRLATGEAADEQAYYQEHQLDALRAQAHFLRAGAGGAAVDGSFAELLRTLGQEMDDSGIEMSGITQEAEGFRVSGVCDNIYRTQLCYFSELEEASALHRADRGTGGGHTAEEIDPFLAVTPGAPVFTYDNQRLGKVGEVRGRSFRVETPFLRRDFWLPATTVAAAAEGEPVLLSIPRSRIDFHKHPPPPAGA